MPQVFCDGRAIYKKVLKDFIVHKKGLFIVAPSGTGKSYFVNHQKEKNWVDGDVIWKAAGAIPKGDWWKEGLQRVFEVDQKCDVVTAECMRMGYWILGASYFWLVPDAIVIPDLKTQKRYILDRQKNAYDGGARLDDMKNVLNHRAWLLDQAKQHRIPVFKSIDAACYSGWMT